MLPISQKAHDISYAVFRCAAVMGNSELRKEIENASVDFLATLPLKLSTESWEGVDKLERLISLAESVGEIKTVNALVLRREIVNLQTAIEFHVSTQAANAAAKTSGNLDISDMFARTELPDKLIETKRTITQPNMVKPSSDNSITDRQNNILRFIREIPFCRLRNILETMPDVSERTVRNDIQNLIERQLVKRIGGGGPNSYFESLEVSLPSQTAITR